MALIVKKSTSFSAGGLNITGQASILAPGVASGIVTAGLVLYFDAANAASYSGSGTTIYDLSGQGAHGTINGGGISWVSNGDASHWSFSTGSDSNYISSTATANYVDCTIVFEPDFTLNNSGAYEIVGLLSTGPNGSYHDRSLRLWNVDGTGPWECRNPDPYSGYGWTNTANTWYVNGTAHTESTISLPSGWNILGVTRNNLDGLFGSPWACHVGSGGYPGRGFRGKIAAVLLYNSPLTQQQQEQNYAALRSRYGL